MSTIWPWFLHGKINKNLSIMYHSIMRQGVQQQLKKTGSADLVIGLPSYKNPANAARVARQALAGVRQYYPHLRTALINADAGHGQTTRQAVLAQGSKNGHNDTVLAGRYTGPLGVGNATAALLDAALALDAQAIIILDSNTATIAPNWIPALASLVLEDKADLVMPRYHWAIPEGALSDLIAYPLTRALWGQTVRHPAAPDFALSPRLAVNLLDADIWQTEAAAHGFPPWLTTCAALNRWRVAQTALGQKSASPPPGYVQLSQRPPFFSDNFYEVVTVLFRQLAQYRPRWDNVDRFGMASTLTRFAGEPAPRPAPLHNVDALWDNLALGWVEYRRFWQAILIEENLARLETLVALPADNLYFPADLWARIVFDFAVVFNKGESDPYQIVKSLLPLYLGRLAAFSYEIDGLALVGWEGTVAAQAAEFEAARPYLKIRWHTYPPWLDYGDPENMLF
jgi:hypothetical protein